MKPKTLIGLIVVLVALAAVYMWLPNEAAKSNRPETSIERGRKLFPDLDSDFAARIQLAAGEGTLELKKSDTEWVVLDEGQEKPAAADRVKRMLDGLAEATVSDVASTRADTHGIYEVDDATATRLLIEDDGGKKVAEILIGKQQFARFPGSDEVLKASTNLNYTVQVYPPARDLRASTWVDKAMWNVERDNVLAITLADATQTVVIERDREGGSDWTVTQPERFPANSGKVNTLLSRFARPYASELLLDVTPEVTGLDQPIARVIVSATPDETHVLHYGRSDGTQRYARTEDRPEYVYQVFGSSYFDDVFNKPLDEWRQPTPTPAPLPGAATGEVVPVTAPPGGGAWPDEALPEIEIVPQME